MVVNKRHREFYRVDVDSGSECPMGYRPGVWHGLFRSENGCLWVETHYYELQ